nr:copia protein [Tanacetum cinerariifolium]
MNYQPVTAGNQSNPSIDPQNTNGDAAFEVKEPEFEGRKPESEVHVSLSSSSQTKKHGDKTKREAKGKSHVELSKGYRNSSADLEYFSDNNINEVNAADTLVPDVRQISTNSTNTLSAASPSNTAVSLTHEKSSYMDPSQYPDDLNMPELEDITYFDDEKDVGVEADFTNLETNITEELLQFKMQKVWVLVDLPNGKRAIGTKWVFRNKKDERDIVVGNKARLVAQGYTQEEGIDYKEVFAPVARIEATRLFLAYVSFMGFMVYQIDVKSAFLYRTIKEEKPDGILISQDKYVAEILRKFGLTDEKSASTHIDTEKPLLKDPDDISKEATLGLWYPKDSPFNLVAYSDSDYAGASLDKKSTTGGCQFLRCRLISWHCKKQTVIATSFTEAEYIAAAKSIAGLWV